MTEKGGFALPWFGEVRRINLNVTCCKRERLKPSFLLSYFVASYGFGGYGDRERKKEGA